MLQIIDRRLNGRNKSAVNRERFLRRYKERIREAVKGMVGERSIADMDKGGDVNIPARDVSEPSFRHDRGGDSESVHPGNKEFIPGTSIPRPQRGGGGKGGAPGSGAATDDFVFSLSREEFLNIFFDDLELPRLARTAIGDTEQKKFSRAGFVKDGSRANLSITRTMRTALARRIALSGVVAEQLRDARERLDQARAECRSDEDIAAIETEIVILESRRLHVPMLDELDLRYRNVVTVSQPVARAAMFCLMDVSASMDETRKDLAKRFYTLLYLFLTRKYEKVDLIFIRHTDDAEEVDEQTFFHDTRSGGTVVLSALELAHKIVTDRYPAGQWNLYFAQASDGDAFGADAGRCASFLQQHLLPMARYFAYIETNEFESQHASSLWAGYEAVTLPYFTMRRVARPGDIYPVFRELFSKGSNA